jgi:hypothetical protein
MMNDFDEYIVYLNIVVDFSNNEILNSYCETTWSGNIKSINYEIDRKIEETKKKRRP